MSVAAGGVAPVSDGAAALPGNAAPASTAAAVASPSEGTKSEGNTENTPGSDPAASESAVAGLPRVTQATPRKPLNYHELVRKKKIEMGLAVPPTAAELAKDNEEELKDLEDGAVVVSNVFGRMFTLHAGNIFKKWGRGVPLGEADALRVAHEGGLPVPKVYGAEITKGGRGCISMEYFPGTKALTEVWQDLAVEEKRDYCRQLCAILQKMRSLEPPGFIGACDGKEIRDLRLYDVYKSPICADEEAFKQHLLTSLYRTIPSAVKAAIAERLAKQPPHRIVLTHGDLAPRNILVDPLTHKIVALVDWENAGWYPEYWEYVKFFHHTASLKTHEKDWTSFADDIFGFKEGEQYSDGLVDFFCLTRWQQP